MVACLEDGAIVQRRITWVGSNEIDVASQSRPRDACPIRVGRGAFGADLPKRDLLLTPEHCLLVEGRLIPVRMLVNGRSIVIDESFTRYGYHHVELARHGILLAEGLPAESYFDTGNRDLFVEPGGRAARQAPAAPLATDRATVEPIWQRLALDAAQLGFEAGPPVAQVLTQEPALRLLLDDGQVVAADWFDAARYMFHIPRDRQAVRLLSRAAAPSETIGPFVDDRRRLGVAVEKLRAWDGSKCVVREASDYHGAGWHALENGARWTDGAADLDLPKAGDAGGFLHVGLRATARYPLA